LAARVRDFECKTIATLVKRYGNSVEAKRHIASELGISVATLYNKIKVTDA
jgi:sigma-54 dependent transcriptional regulator, acetoin dehydrogenase operon transcriptional activator AcoR